MARTSPARAHTPPRTPPGPRLHVRRSPDRTRAHAPETRTAARTDAPRSTAPPMPAPIRPWSPPCPVVVASLDPTDAPAAGEASGPLPGRGSESGATVYGTDRAALAGRPRQRNTNNVSTTIYDPKTTDRGATKDLCFPHPCHR